MRKNIHGAPAVGGFERSGPNDEQPGSYSGPEVLFAEIVIDLLQPRFCGIGVPPARDTTLGAMCFDDSDDVYRE